MIEGDSIRNITGNTNTFTELNYDGGSSFGAFYSSIKFSAGGGTSSYGATGDINYFSASRVVPTSTENHPVNMAVRYIIKAD